MGKILGNCLNDGPRNPQDPRPWTPPVFDKNDPKFQQQFVIKIQELRDLLNRLRNR